MGLVVVALEVEEEVGRGNILERSIVIMRVRIKEGSHSGLVRTLGKRVWGNSPGVRISYLTP